MDMSSVGSFLVVGLLGFVVGSELRRGLVEGGLEGARKRWTEDLAQGHWELGDLLIMVQLVKPTITSNQ